ncbi:MAG: hypothetical protein QOE53_2074 [Pseudonocardiales bacterium]|nr:hypothetical protein [Pseudonocardiales bacterium]
MTTPARLRSLVRQALQQAGFTPKGSAWLWAGSEVSWLVALDRSPTAPRYTLELGASPGSASAQQPNNCPVLVHLENLPLGGADVDFRDRALRAFDLSSAMDDSVREQEIGWVLDRTIGYLTSLGELSALKRRYAAGDLESAFIHKDLRGQLSS